MNRLSPDLVERLTELKKQYQTEGFVILGVFGSVARSEETPDSDIDLLYQVEASFFSRNHGFDAFTRLEAIKQEMMTALCRKVDLAPKNTVNRILNQEIERDIIYV